MRWDDARWQAPRPTEFLSGLAGGLARVPIPGSAPLFAWAAGIDVQDGERPPWRYPSVLSYFTRRLKPGARPVDPTAGALVGPCDGRLAAFGPVGGGQLVQCKGRRYSLEALMGRSAGSFRGGSYATVYLSPADYHRVHAPFTAHLVEATVVPGVLMPVMPRVLRYAEGVFVRNRRLVLHLRSQDFGAVVLILVGATNVGGIRATFDPELTRSYRRRRQQRYAPPVHLKRGQEVGVFELGSTVIVVTERPVGFDGVREGSRVQMGAVLGWQHPVGGGLTDRREAGSAPSP